MLSAAGGLLLLAAKMKPKESTRVSHGLHLGSGWPARTIRKVSWPWATDSSGRRRLAGVADPPGFADAAGLAALGKG